MERGKLVSKLGTEGPKRKKDNATARKIGRGRMKVGRRWALAAMSRPNTIPSLQFLDDPDRYE